MAPSNPVGLVPSPPFPPSFPPMTNDVYYIEMTFIFEGNVDTFNVPKFRASLSTVVNMTKENVLINISPGSVIAEVKIYTSFYKKSLEIFNKLNFLAKNIDVLGNLLDFPNLVAINELQILPETRNVERDDSKIFRASLVILFTLLILILSIVMYPFIKKRRAQIQISITSNNINYI